METTTTYFEQRGKGNTQRVLELARARAQALGIDRIIVPTTAGTTGVRAVEELAGFQVIVVTHSAGFTEAGRLETPPETVAELRAKGAQVVTATHAFGGVGRAVRKKFDTWQVEEIIAQTLKRFGEGTKVAVEVSLMAADAGLVSPHREVIACGGSGHGVDTALVLMPTHAQTFFDLDILEVICKPRQP
jgi:hypothetical protein